VYIARVHGCGVYVCIVSKVWGYPNVCMGLKHSISYLAHSNELMQWRVVCCLSVRPSANLFRKSLLLPDKWPDRHQTCTRWSPEAYIQGVVTAQVQGWGERSRHTSTFGISQKSLTQPFPNFSFPLSIQFYSASQSQNGCDFVLWVTLTWWNSLSDW